MAADIITSADAVMDSIPSANVLGTVDEYKGQSHVSTTNACKLCTPLGATLAFKGVEGAIPFLHGSQGCATYMRRYIISHFREPMDIASSSLGEKNAIYGGGPNLKKGLLNAMQKYGAGVIGVATTCLTETIGDDVGRLLAEFREEFKDLPLAELVHVSTPSYSGTHMDGFHGAVRAIVEQLCVEQLCTEKAAAHDRVNLLPGMVSPADIRHLREICRGFGVEPTILPDYSETLDGPALLEYENIPSGGTKVADIKAMGGARASIELGRAITSQETAGTSLRKRFGVPLHSLGLPLGLRETDSFFAALREITGRETPRDLALERGRYIDSLVDGHKYVSGLKAVVYGEEDMVIGLTSFLAEIGVRPVLVATGAKNRGVAEHIEAIAGAACGPVLRHMPIVREGADFFDIVEEAKTLSPDILVGHSKGQRAAREWNIPLLRVGFPIHDRFGGQRMLHLGYRGAQNLFDRLVNIVLEKKQTDSDIGYGYL